MFKTSPFVSEKVWGCEYWIVSTHAAGQSLIDDADSENDGQPVITELKDEYQQLIKIIQANETLSVQVHPNDEFARKVENTYGKTECWYILDAVEGASLVCGLTPGCSREKLAAALEEGSQNAVEQCLREIPVTKGDFVFIPAGTVHAIKGGLRILEVQEPSDITYRLYDWGRKREMHVEKALQVISYEEPCITRDFTGPFKCPYFFLERRVIDPFATESDRTIRFAGAENPFVTLFIIDGIAELTATDGKSIIVQSEDTIICHRDEAVTITSAEHKEVSVMIIQ